MRFLRATTPLGSRTGAVRRRLLLGLYPRFPLRARLGVAVDPVGIELRRASCRWRVTGLALSICETGAHFHHGHVSGGPPIIPDGRISQVRLETLAFFREPSRRRRGSSAGSHTPRLPWFAHSLASRPASALRRFYQAGHRTDKDTAKCPESLRPLPVLPP